jgi:hypothetical protein
VRESSHLADLQIDGRTILKWLFKTWDGGMDCIDLVQECECEYSNEPLGSIKCREFLD